MSDPFAAPQAAPRLSAAEALDVPALRFARWTLVFCGLMYILMGVGAGPLVAWSVQADHPGEPVSSGFTVGLSLVMFLFIAGFGSLNFVAVWGLGRGAKWAWIMALVLGGIYLPSGCFPFGAIVLYGLLKDEVRKAYLG